MRRTPLVLAASLVLALPAAAGARITGPPEVVASGFGAPWEVVLVPDGRTWVADRDCAVVEVRDGERVPLLQGGAACRKFLGLELHPGFAQNRLAYLYETYDTGAGARSRIRRLRDTGTALAEEGVVLDGIRSDLSHDGGRMRFGPDGKLYVTTGDVHDPSLPQDVTKLNGKVLRLEAPGGAGDGAAPADNPFAGQDGGAPYVWSYGHRHPQGLAFDSAGRLWLSEHGPSGEAHAPEGARTGRDEVNLVVRGGNYGWPLVAGEQTREGTIAPAAVAGAEPWAPGGAAIGADGALYVPMLAGRGLLRFGVTCAGLGPREVLLTDRGQRLRTASAGRGFLWLSTDGVGTGDEVLRAPLDDEGFAGLSCGAPVAPAPATTPDGGGTTPDGGGTTPASPANGGSFAGDALVEDPVLAGGPGGPGGPAGASSVLAVRLDTLLARTQTVLRRAGARKLVSRRGVVVRVGGLGTGTLTLRARLRRAGGRTSPLALRTVRSTGGHTVTVRLRGGAAARRALAGRRTASIGLLARFVPDTRPGLDRVLSLRVRR